MKRLREGVQRAQRGMTLIELLVALAVFVMFILMIDAVFSSVRTNARKTELAADTQQNARIAVERITREIREGDSGAALLLLDNSLGPGQSRIVFKSARLTTDSTVFCLYARVNSAPIYNPLCFTGSGSFSPAVLAPPYAFNCPCPPGEPAAPRGTYTPLWQQYIGYYVTSTPDGFYALWRVVGPLTAPDQPLSLTMLTGGSTAATRVQSFDVALSSGIVAVTLKGKGTEVVQGQAIPAQEILLPGQVMTRN